MTPLEKDAARYRFLRSAAARDHKHHTQRAAVAGVVDWAKKFDKTANQNFWSVDYLTGEDLDAQLDKLMRRRRK